MRRERRRRRWPLSRVRGYQRKVGGGGLPFARHAGDGRWATRAEAADERIDRTQIAAVERAQIGPRHRRMSATGAHLVEPLLFGNLAEALAHVGGIHRSPRAAEAGRAPD